MLQDVSKENTSLYVFLIFLIKFLLNKNLTGRKQDEKVLYANVVFLQGVVKSLSILEVH